MHLGEFRRSFEDKALGLIILNFILCLYIACMDLCNICVSSGPSTAFLFEERPPSLNQVL